MYSDKNINRLRKKSINLSTMSLDVVKTSQLETAT